jgi:hypothetical protein
MTFIDHGTLCEPPSILRKTTKPFITPCAQNQIDRNGNCFEPQVVFYDSPSDPSQLPKPRVTGCGCIRVTAKERIKCPPGQDVYNNTCLVGCPDGYSAVRDLSTKEVISMYCQKDCPEKTLTKGQRETRVGNQCVKESYSRLASQNLPVTTLSVLASRPLGSSLNDRNPASARPFGSSDPSFWTWLFNLAPKAWEKDIVFLLYVAVIAAVIFYAGPTFLPLLGNAVGQILNGVLGATSNVLTSTSKAAGKIISATGDVAAELEKGAADLTKARLDVRANDTLKKSTDALAESYANLSKQAQLSVKSIKQDV